MFAWPLTSVADVGNDDGTETPDGGVTVSFTASLTEESSDRPPVSASRLIASELLTDGVGLYVINLSTFYEIDPMTLTSKRCKRSCQIDRRNRKKVASCGRTLLLKLFTSQRPMP